MLYFPRVAEGMILKVGRFISPPDIEAQLATNNYLYTHSVMFTYDAYTFTGAQATFKLFMCRSGSLASHWFMTTCAS